MVPRRAGAIVSEFIGSVIAEAQARADEIVLAAHEEADAERAEALALAARVRERHEALADALTAFREELHRQADSLPAEAVTSTHLESGQAPAVTGVALELAAPAPLTPPNGHDADETVAGEVVNAEVADEEAAAEAAGDDDDEAVVDAQEPDNRYERMSDAELARAHVNAIKAAERDADNERGESMRRLAHAALQEALRRPAFTEEPAPRWRLRRLFRRGRKRDVALDELREACRRALAP